MTKQSIFPYYADALRAVKGVEVLDIEGAAMMHFNDVDDEQAQVLKYPCRIDALIMVLCVRGEVAFSSQMSEYRLKANQFFISSASVLQFHAMAGSEFYMLLYKREFMTKMNLDIRFMTDMMAALRNTSNIFKVGDVELAKFGTTFNLLFNDYGGRSISDYQAMSLHYAFTSLFYRVYDVLTEKGGAGTSCGSRDRATELFERLVQLISEHYREQRSVEFYAEQMNISSKHLSRVIGNSTGKSVHQWIDEFVVLEIKNLLKYSDMSVQQISYVLNFPNPSFMGQYFKRITGMTPGEYKRS